MNNILNLKSAIENGKHAELEPAKLPEMFRYDSHRSIQFLEGEGKKDADPSWTWLCSPLKVLAKTADALSKNNGLLIRLQAPAKVWHEVALPAELWANDGRELRAILASLGLHMNNSPKAKLALLNLFSWIRPQAEALCVDRIGWHKLTFVLPDRAFGMEKVGKVVFQSAFPAHHAFEPAGTLEDWQANIAAFAMGNSRLILAISTAFAAPLLHVAQVESGGLHFRGGSSNGKTTALHVAGSVWGGGDVQGYVKSWRATDNALESVAASHCDALLCIDELGQVAPEAVAEASYMLANGQGKQRANKNGMARAIAEWRLLYLSTGEISLSDKIAQSRLRNSRAMAGQQVRFIDLSADAGAGMGLFENCHGMEPGAFALKLKENSGLYYGVPARAFLSELVRQDFDQCRTLITHMQRQFVDSVANGRDGQVQRVAGRFGLIAAAGELATQWNITGWSKGTATEAAKRLFGDWLAERGHDGPAEIIEGIKQVRSFIEQHGASRFTPWDTAGNEPERITMNRCGFVKTGSDGPVYYIFPNAWRNQVCSGFDAQQIARALVDRGALSPGDGRNIAKRITWPDKARKPRAYVLDLGGLEDE